MKKALCEPSGRVAQIVVVGAEFPVHPSLVWVDATDDITTNHVWNGSTFIAPVPPPNPTTISYEAYQDRFTTAEFNAATDFVYESDLVTGKPKRRAMIQGLSRAMAKNSINLIDARTIAFMNALVVGTIITAQRKTEILTP